MNVPREFWRVKVKHIQDPKVRTAVVRYLKRMDEMFKRGVGLLLCGEPGVGKTAAAIVIAKEVRSYSYSVFFTSVWEMRESLKSRINFDDDNSFTDKARDSDFLVLDNVKPEDSKEPFLNLRSIEDLITFRCSQSRPTFITTRVPVGRLEKELPGVLDACMGKVIEVDLTGKDLRDRTHADLADELFGDGDGS